MRQIATAVFGVGVAIATFGITRYMTFREFPPPRNPLAVEGDPVYYTEFERVIATVLIGFLELALSAYLFSRARVKIS